VENYCSAGQGTDNVENYCSAGQGIEDNMAHAILYAAYLRLQTHTQNM
jgi:hypothetical protein